MRRTLFYLSAALLAFGIGSFVVYKFYIRANTDRNSSVNYVSTISKYAEQIEADNVGFDEMLKANNADFVIAQGFIDEKFLCLDVTDSQQNVCTTVLIGSSLEKKSLLIRLQVCNERTKSNCIVWKPNNLCPDNRLCSDKIKIYDSNSKPTELVEYLPDSKGYHHKNIQLKVTGKVSIVEGKARLLNPIQSIKIIE